MSVVNSDYWLERYFISREQQRTALEFARMNERHTPARRGWLEAARHDAICKRLHWSYQ